jgi:hypothetical protein
VVGTNHVLTDIPMTPTVLPAATSCLSFDIGYGGVLKPFPDTLQMRSCAGLATCLLKSFICVCKTINSSKLILLCFKILTYNQ